MFAKCDVKHLVITAICLFLEQKQLMVIRILMLFHGVDVIAHG